MCLTLRPLSLLGALRPRFTLIEWHSLALARIHLPFAILANSLFSHPEATGTDRQFAEVIRLQRQFPRHVTQFPTVSVRRLLLHVDVNPHLDVGETSFATGLTLTHGQILKWVGLKVPGMKMEILVVLPAAPVLLTTMDPIPAVHLLVRLPLQSPCRLTIAQVAHRSSLHRPVLEGVHPLAERAPAMVLMAGIHPAVAILPSPHTMVLIVTRTMTRVPAVTALLMARVARIHTVPITMALLHSIHPARLSAQITAPPPPIRVPSAFSITSPASRPSSLEANWSLQAWTLRLKNVSLS